MNNFGVSILVWLSIGFIVGLKRIYLDKKNSEENINKTIKELVDDGHDEIAVEYNANLYMRNTKVLLTIYTLFGIITFIGDTVATFKKKND